MDRCLDERSFCLGICVAVRFQRFGKIPLERQVAVEHVTVRSKNIPKRDMISPELTRSLDRVKVKHCLTLVRLHKIPTLRQLRLELGEVSVSVSGQIRDSSLD